jgi:hypothetical protein
MKYHPATFTELVRKATKHHTVAVSRSKIQTGYFQNGVRFVFLKSVGNKKFYFGDIIAAKLNRISPETANARGENIFLFGEV